MTSDLNERRRLLTRLWTEQLYKEYELICFQHKQRMRRPVLRISPMTGLWGSWDAETRTITLASQLVESYGWDVVLEILKHEMAHQLVTEVFGEDEAHGPHFREACRQLGIAEWACRAETDLAMPIGHWKDRPLAGAEERLLKKVEKLLSLATSSNEHEALLAMEKARELYARHNLERICERKESGMVYLLLQSKKKRIERYESVIASILVEHFSVEVIHSNLYDPGDLCEYKVIEVLGTPENVLMAEYVYHFLRNKIHQLWEDYRRTAGKTGRSKRSYLLGVLAGFRKQLENSKKPQGKPAKVVSKKSEAEIRQLVLLEDRRLQDYVKRRYPRLVNKSWGRYLRDGQSYSAGVGEGLKLTLNKGIRHKQGNRGHLLNS